MQCRRDARERFDIKNCLPNVCVFLSCSVVDKEAGSRHNLIRFEFVPEYFCMSVTRICKQYCYLPGYGEFLSSFRSFIFLATHLSRFNFGDDVSHKGLLQPDQSHVEEDRHFDCELGENKIRGNINRIKFSPYGRRIL